MIRYHPPKSQVWGHQVGRLTATEVVDRCRRFLDEQCMVVNSQPSELTVGWNSGRDALLLGIVAEVEQTLGPATAVVERPGPGGQVFRLRRWPFAAEKLAAVGAWFDRLADAMETPEVVAHSSTIWGFAWRDEPPQVRALESPGGMFGVHLGRPHRISTLFSFRDLERYAMIKRYLEEVGLARLSDKHLRPKVRVDAKKGRDAGSQG